MARSSAEIGIEEMTARAGYSVSVAVGGLGHHGDGAGPPAWRILVDLGLP